MDTRCKSHKQSLDEDLRDVNDAVRQMEATKSVVCCVLCVVRAHGTAPTPAPATGVTA